MEGSGRRKSVVWPLVLIGLGIIFLLNNLGILSWAVWSVLWRMWPVVVIALGLDLIMGRRSGWWSAITVLLVLGMFGGAFWLVTATGESWQRDLVNVPISQPLEEADSAAVRLEIGVGTLLVDAQPEGSDLLIEGNIDLSDAEDYREKVGTADGEMQYSLTNPYSQYAPGWLLSHMDDHIKTWDVQLNPDVELDLRVDTGVGKTTLDLRGLQLVSLSVDSGVGEVDIYLPSVGEMDVRVDVGVGKVTVFVPAGMAVRLRVDAGLGNVKLDGNFASENGFYYSTAYDEDAPFIDIFLDGGVGNLGVIEMD